MEHAVVKNRWWIYLRERFPVFAHGPLIAAFSLSAVCCSSLLRGDHRLPSALSLIVAFCTSLLFFLQLRIADEFKDFEDDARHRPYRPVPRGLVSLRELGVVGVLGAAVQLGLAFKYVEGSIAGRLLERARYAVTALDPAANPYLQWILTGRHLTALPLALRPEHFETIRSNLDRLEWRCRPLEDFLQTQGKAAIDRFNLSDIFEYMSPENTQRVLEKLAISGRPGGRLAYWNTLVPRSRPDSMADRLWPLADLAERLHRQDKAFFYSRFVVEEIL